MLMSDLDERYVQTLALCRGGAFAAAERQLLELLSEAPERSYLWHDLGGVYVMTRRFPEAEAAIRRALALDPAVPESHYMLSSVLLGRGDWRAGWPEFEWRLACRQTAPVELDLPLWDGSPLSGEHLLLVADQGLGDTLQFLRFVPWLAQQHVRLSIWGPDPTTPLLARLPYFAFAKTYIQDIPQPDCYLPLLSLPSRLAAAQVTLPPPAPLQIDREKSREYARRLGPRRERLRLGIAWAGNPLQRDNIARSMPIAALAPLMAVADVRWISVQMGAAADECAVYPGRLENWSTHVQSLDDTAALFTALDGVLSVCSAPLHLAGTLNRQSIGVLSTRADWRWGYEGSQSAWYPRMQLTRQTTPGDWSVPIAQAIDYLANWKQEALV